MKNCLRRAMRRCDKTRARKTRLRRAAYSLLEVTLASAICATALVPALVILRNGMELARDVDTRHMLLLYGVQKMEEQLAYSAGSWTEGTSSGDFSTDGHANIRYSETRSDDAADGGITNRLMAITVTVYSDEDGDDTLDSGEPNMTLTSKIGKFATYESLAGS